MYTVTAGTLYVHFVIHSYVCLHVSILVLDSTSLSVPNKTNDKSIKSVTESHVYFLVLCRIKKIVCKNGTYYRQIITQRVGVVVVYKDKTPFICVQKANICTEFFIKSVTEK